MAAKVSFVLPDDGCRMLKITILDGGAKQRLVVEGKLAEPWVSELEVAWNRARQAGRSRQIVVDLSGVTLIDPRGEATLRAMIADGARLAAKGLYCEYVAEQLMKTVRKGRPRCHRHDAARARGSSSGK